MQDRVLRPYYVKRCILERDIFKVTVHDLYQMIQTLLSAHLPVALVLDLTEVESDHFGAIRIGQEPCGSAVSRSQIKHTMALAQFGYPAHHLLHLSLIHISEPTRLRRISYAVFCLKKK